MESIKNIIDSVTELLKNLRDFGAGQFLFLFSFFFFFISFCPSCDFSKKSFNFQTIPSLWSFIVGILFLIGGFLFFMFFNNKTNFKIKITKKENNMNIEHTNVSILIGKIEEFTNIPKKCAFVLPANTNFIDDCIRDTGSALGAFMNKHFPDEICDFSKTVEDSLKNEGFTKDAEGRFKKGTSIILPRPFEKHFKVIVSGVTNREKRKGIYSTPSHIIETIQNIFEVTADKKISSLIMPVLGTGHGGISIDSAINLILCSIHFFARKYHHIKEIKIVVFNKDKKSLEMQLFKFGEIS